MIFSQVEYIGLRDQSLFALCQFVKHNEMSTYQMFKTLKDTEFKAEYKNIHKKIQMFLEQKFIEKTRTIDRKHASFYYRLTSTGVLCIFYYLHGKSSLIWGQMKDIITGLLNNYGNDKFFDLFVYPHIVSNF